MKRQKALSLLLALALLLSLLSACSSSTKYPMTEQHEKLGRKALEIADAYLDFDLSLDDACEKIKDLYHALDTLPEGTREQSDGNRSLDLRVTLLESAFSHAKLRASGLYGVASKESADILGARNDLAELLGVKAR